MLKARILLVFLVVLSIGWAEQTRCETCSANDCSSPLTTESCTNDYGCFRINSETSSPASACGKTSALICTSPSFSVDSASTLSYGSYPYYCINYNRLTDVYVWKTCYPGTPAGNWTSTKLACDSSRSSNNLRECGSLTYGGTQAVSCESVKTSSGDFYCPSGAASWQTASGAKDVCPSACESFTAHTWTGTKCCYAGKYYIDGAKACDNSVVESSCGDSVTVESITYYRDNLAWTSSPSLDSCESLCEAGVFSKEWDDSTNKCCDGSDNFRFNSLTSKMCVNGAAKSCGSGYDLCGSVNSYKCIKDDSGQFYWSSGDCSGYGACVGVAWSDIGCSAKDGWTNYGDTGLNCPSDDPTAVYKTYTCSSGLCTGTDSQTKECDASDGWYGGGNLGGCGSDTSIEQRDYYVASNGVCTYTVCQTKNCDSQDICSDHCNGNIASGGTDYFYASISSVQISEPICQMSTNSQVDCSQKASEEFEGSGTDKYLLPGYVYDYTTCLSGACLFENKTDSCQVDTLTEYSASSSSFSSLTKDCNNYDMCAEDASRTANRKYFKDFKCKTSGAGYCGFDEIDLDTDQAKCTSATYQCGLNWASGKCCGDDAGEFYRTGSDGTLACCGSETSCVKAGNCVASGSFDSTTSPTMYCNGGSEKLATTDCDTVLAGQTYYALAGRWVLKEKANATCPAACSQMAGDWAYNVVDVKYGFKCCLSESEGSWVGLSGDQALCSNSKWTKASENAGLLKNLPSGKYISTSVEWKNCTKTGDKVVANNKNFVCVLPFGWQDENCSIQGDASSDFCVGCGGTWISSFSGTSKACCGDDADDYFWVVQYTSICQGTTGKLQNCDTQCKTATISGMNYYCFGSEWKTNSLFSGTTYLQYGSTAGCCSQGQCWNNGCFDSGKTDASGNLCYSGSWYACNQTSLCSARGNSYCSDGGWTSSQSMFCQNGKGMCLGGMCKLCGVDYNITDVVSGYLCTSSGVFNLGCLSDQDCVSADECKLGKCSTGQCVYDSKTCGQSCSSGVCDGLGACKVKSTEGQSCSCSEACATGLSCEGGTCKKSLTCGDQTCQPGECSSCPTDCSLDKCKNDKVCGIEIGENCQNSETDCSCAGKYCDPSSASSDSRGCVGASCGNAFCEPSECSYCTADCSVNDCAGNGKCETIMGETCDNSDDCTCEIKITTETRPVLRVGEFTSMRVYVENNGNAPMLVKLEIDTELFEIQGGGQSVYLAPNERKEVVIEVKPKTTGVQNMNVMATSGGAQVSTEDLEITVKDQTVWENFLVWFKHTPIWSLYESLDVVVGILGIGAAVFAFFRFVVPHKAAIRNPYGVAYPGYYYGSKYAGGYYPRQQNYRRGYYRF